MGRAIDVDLEAIVGLIPGLDDLRYLFFDRATRRIGDRRKKEGAGKILGLTIALETGEAKRFADAGNFASYSRCVKSLRTSNGKKKGENNRKCGNNYLAWAFVEA